MGLIGRDEQAIRTYVDALEDEREGDRVGERVLLGLRKEYDAALQRQRGAVATLDAADSVARMLAEALRATRTDDEQTREALTMFDLYNAKRGR